ncbi:hypothetical protein [Neobacillus citreus]|uniref:hypothetical protein n=1 Tax=Neobacillus TaxID=2675232 RepID=UPI001F141FD0|nr:hypothetical protein [Neobacillus citreus]
MEKALLNAHGVCYKVYCRNHDIRILVEKRREQDYITSQMMLADIGRKFHT